MMVLLVSDCKASNPGMLVVPGRPQRAHPQPRCMPSQAHTVAHAHMRCRWVCIDWLWTLACLLEAPGQAAAAGLREAQ